MARSAQVSSSRVWSNSLSAASCHPSLQPKTTEIAAIGVLAKIQVPMKYSSIQSSSFGLDCSQHSAGGQRIVIQHAASFLANTCSGRPKHNC
jgi:hypothetical protein